MDEGMSRTQPDLGRRSVRVRPLGGGQAIDLTIGAVSLELQRISQNCWWDLATNLRAAALARWEASYSSESLRRTISSLPVVMAFRLRG